MIDRISSDMTSMEKSPAPVLSSNAVFSLNSTLIWVHLNVVYVESQPMRDAKVQVYRENNNITIYMQSMSNTNQVCMGTPLEV